MVVCKLCGRKFVKITNSHLKKFHNMTNVDEYKEMFPGAETASEEYLKKMSTVLMGKNKGNARPDARKRMLKSNPMKDKETAKKVGAIRRSMIVSGEIDVMKNFNHLPTAYEKRLIRWFRSWKIPLTYVGDGKVKIHSYCPDFINEDEKIILELVLNFTQTPRSEISAKEQAYVKAGYRTIWITKMDRDYIHKWTHFAFYGFPSKPVKIKKVWTEDFHEGEFKNRREFVYNIEVSPNNTYVANNIVVHNCYANAFRASLYTAFYDNSKTMGLRHCNPNYYKQEMDKMLKYRSFNRGEKQNLFGIDKAFALEIPMRMGIRFEDFLPKERKEGISLTMLQYLRDIEYPVMINSKSDLPAEDAYVRALAENKAGAAIHITLISSNNDTLKKLEPGAPSYDRRIAAMKVLSNAGVRVVARIEPYLFLLTDDKAEVEKYINDVWEAGVRHITFDTYSYTALNPGIRQSFINEGYDFDRLFLAGCDSQPLGSLLLGKFMELFREKGFSCSTFDMGNVSSNDQAVCCEVGDWFKGEFSYGCTVMAARFIKLSKGNYVSWKDFETWVDGHGGFLTEGLKMEVKMLWNLQGNVAYSHRWAAGLTPVGMDEDGTIWTYEETDYREELLNSMI